MLKLCVYVPETHLEQVKQALFDAGAGRMSHYDCCSWQTLGAGQFRPLEGAHPAVGVIDEVARVPEWKLEMVCPENLAPAVVRALFEAHPYETPAFDFIELWHLPE